VSSDEDENVAEEEYVRQVMEELVAPSYYNLHHIGCDPVTPEIVVHLRTEESDMEDMD
jgi:hypothetical protein